MSIISIKLPKASKIELTHNQKKSLQAAIEDHATDDPGQISNPALALKTPVGTFTGRYSRNTQEIEYELSSFEPKGK